MLMRSGQIAMPYHDFRIFLERAGLSEKEGSDLFRIPARTLARRKKTGLSDTEADRVERAQRILELAKTVFESEKKAREWMHKPMPALDNRTPVSMLGTDRETVEVERLLGQIDFMVYP